MRAIRDGCRTVLLRLSLALLLCSLMVTVIHCIVVSGGNPHGLTPGDPVARSQHLGLGRDARPTGGGGFTTAETPRVAAFKI